MSEGQDNTQGGAGPTVPVAASEAPEPAAVPLPPLAGEGLRARFAGRSVVGLVREHNEDNLIITNLTSGEVAAREALCEDRVSEGGMLFAVCDGMGGAAAGEVASQMAVDILHEAMRRGGPPKERDDLARRLVSAVEEAGKRIFDAAQKERSRRGMGTTATVGVLIDQILFFAEVGDSRAYLLRGGVLKQLTKDQSLVNQLIEAGHLTEAEAEAFEHSNIILQALGTSETVQVDLTFVELRQGDRVMMCSDGLSGLVHVDTLRDALANVADPVECTATLVKYAEAGGGHDNITVIVADFGGDALAAARENDSFGYVQYPLVSAEAASAAFSDEEITDAGAPTPASAVSRPDTDAPSEAPADGSSWMWVSAGIVALLIGAWVLAVSSSGGSAGAYDDPGNVVAGTETPAAQPRGPGPAAVEHAPVAVRVFTDVEGATLLVNGEARGPLSTTGSRDLELPPGAYRFEAQSQGSTPAVEVVTVRPGVPLEVHLRLPTGAAGTAVAQPAEPAAAPAPAAAEPSKAEPPTAEPSKAEPSKAAEQPAQVAPSAPSSDPSGVPSNPF